MKRSRSSSRLVSVLTVLLALTAVMVAVATVAGLATVQRIRPRLVSAQMGLAQLESTIAGDPAHLMRLLQEPDELASLQSTLNTLSQDLLGLEQVARPFLPLAPHLGWLPGTGGDVAAAPHLLALARHTTDAAVALTFALIPVASHLGLSDDPQSAAGLADVGPALLGSLVQVRPQIQAAQDALSRATESRASFSAGRLTPKTHRLVDRFDRYAPLLQQSLQALSALPELLGADGARTYLILAQNNHELRATGGFISGVGRVRIENGGITGLIFQDSYTVDNLAQPHPLPPAPLRRMMGAGMLVLRDANWWPDFPTSATAIADLYRQDQGAPVDGVVAVDLTTLQLLVQALGPIHVPGYDQPVTSEVLQTMLMSLWEAPRLTAPGKEEATWWAHRKDFAADLMSALLTQIMERATPADWTALTQAVGKAIQQRHLLIVVQDPQVADLLRQMGADGALRKTPDAGDYLMIVDSNVGFNKVNPNVEQTVDYWIDLRGAGTPTARLALTYRHRIQRPAPACIHELRYGDSYADLMERCYWDYLRVYLPAGSRLLDLGGSDEPPKIYDESGKMVIGTALVLETGQARQVQFTYQPGIPALQGQYTLLLQRQPGTEALPVRISITLPEGAHPTRAAPENWLWLDGKVVWQTTLDRDVEVAVFWQ